MLYQEFESRILVPRVYGRVLRLSPALVLLALLIGGTLLGVLGALLALPIAAGMQMLVRQLRVDLPGQPDLEEERERDERAEDLYEKLTAGTPAAAAQIIAGELAAKIKRSEHGGGSLTAAMPAIIAEMEEDAREVAAAEVMRRKRRPTRRKPRPTRRKRRRRIQPPGRQNAKANKIPSRLWRPGALAVNFSSLRPARRTCARRAGAWRC